MKIGLLTGGGDCPGLNAVIRAVVQRVNNGGGTCLGILEGWRGLVEGMSRPLEVDETDGIIARGGTILGSSRTNPYKVDGGAEQVKATLAAEGVDALVAIGGEDTLGVAHRLAGEGVPVIGVPKTIDNDLSATELTFGFDTAVQICVDAIDRLHTTAESHDRVMVVEVMGRHAGHIAAWAACDAVAIERRRRDEAPNECPTRRPFIRHGRGAILGREDRVRRCTVEHRRDFGLAVIGRADARK